MQSNRENVILFPKWKTTLEKESLEALEKKEYEIALKKLNKLISYEINDHEIVFGKLICLMELKRYDEAQDLCEELLTFSNENYYHYVHVYLTILFQTSQYNIVMEQVENELMNEEIPKVIKEQFQQLFEMSRQMKQDIVNKESIEYIKELLTAVSEKNFVRQWQLVENLRKMKVNPPEEVIHFLVEEKVHPVIKTVIFKWLRDLKVTESIKVHKFDKQMSINPSKFVKIRNHTITKQTMLLISKLEQKNPSLYILLEQLLYRYIYVRYPIMPANSEVIDLSKALIIIGEQYIHSKIDEVHNEQVEKYVEEIKTCEALYLSIIEE